MLAGGQLLFKQSGMAIAGKPPVQAASTLIALPAFWFSLLLYGVATLLWIVVLSAIYSMWDYFRAFYAQVVREKQAKAKASAAAAATAQERI